VGEVFLDRIDGDEELPRDLPVRLARSDETQHLELAFAQGIGKRLGGSRTIWYRAERTTSGGSTKGREELAHVPRRDVLRSGTREPLLPLRSEPLLQQRGHRLALVHKRAYVAFWFGERQRSFKSGHRSGFIASGFTASGIERQGLDCQYLYGAAGFAPKFVLDSKLQTLNLNYKQLLEPLQSLGP
jgi:hypothetical protein